ncbi:MAG: hypothetical protein H7Y11_11460, partial [Armatimonadetes bacterium]|nr:hypothetical protein [Anaerolineae bacterium]
PVRFQTTIDATLPAGVDAVVEISIEALPDSAGAVGNVQAGVITAVDAEWADNVVVINLAPTANGEDRVLPVVTQADHDRLLAAVQQQLQARALAEFEAILGENEVLIVDTLAITPESTRADWQTFDAEVGAFADTLTLRLNAVVQVVVVNQQRGEEVVFARLGRQIPRGRVILPGSIEYTPGAVTGLDVDGQVTFSMSGYGRVAGQANIPVLQARLAGLTSAEALDYLTSTVDLAPGSTPDIVVSNSLDGRLPRLPVRITVRIVEPGV